MLERNDVFKQKKISEIFAPAQKKLSQVSIRKPDYKLGVLDILYVWLSDIMFYLMIVIKIQKVHFWNWFGWN